MISGVKRSHWTANLDEPIPKRHRTEHLLDPAPSSILSRFDTFIGKFSSWLRETFRRNSNMTSTAQSEELNDEDLIVLTKPILHIEKETNLVDKKVDHYSTPRENTSSHVTKSKRVPYTGPNARTHTGLTPPVTRTHTGPPVTRPHTGPNPPVTRTHSGTHSGTLSPVLNTMRMKHEESIFEQLIGRTDAIDVPKTGRSVPLETTCTAPTTATCNSSFKLYSVDLRNSTPSTKQRPLLSPSPQLNSTRTTYTKNPSLSSSVPSLSRSFLRPTSPINAHPPRVSLTAVKPLDRPESPQPNRKNSFHTTTANELSSRSNSSSLSDWIANFKEEYVNNDYHARLEVARKYAEIQHKERMRADDKRAQKLADLMCELNVRPWTLDIPEEDTVELNFHFDRETNDQIDDIWRTGSLNKVYSEGYNIKIKRNDLLTLSGLEWLNDEVINFYFNLIVETVNNEGKNKVHFFNSFFYSKIMSTGYKGVKRWTKKIDIFSYDLILLPVHLGMHWCLAVIDFRRKLIGYFDSLQGTNTNCLLALKDYLVSEAQDKKQMEYDVSDWTLKCFTNIPGQHNGSDCGVFTCMYARHLARDKPFDFSQKDMPYIRRMMVMEIIHKQLL